MTEPQHLSPCPEAKGISRELMGKIVDDVFGGAIEDASVIEDIYAAIKRHEAAPAVLLRAALVDLCKAYAECNGEDHPAYEAAQHVLASPAPETHATGIELPADIIESLLAIGPVEWGVSLSQSDEKHAADLLDTLRLTREHFGVTDEETGIHGVYLEGTGTVLAHTGMSPNSPQHARILVGAWNQLVEIAKAKAATTEGK